VIPDFAHLAQIAIPSLWLLKAGKRTFRFAESAHVAVGAHGSRRNQRIELLGVRQILYMWRRVKDGENRESACGANHAGNLARADCAHRIAQLRLQLNRTQSSQVSAVVRRCIDGILLGQHSKICARLELLDHLFRLLGAGRDNNAQFKAVRSTLFLRARRRRHTCCEARNQGKRERHCGQVAPRPFCFSIQHSFLLLVMDGRRAAWRFANREKALSA
jgi:hypothetical protein